MSKEKPKILEKPAKGRVESKMEASRDLARSIQNTVQSEWEDALGEKVDFDELAQNTETLDEKIEKLCKAWTGTMDQLFALMAPFRMKPSDVRDAMADSVPPPASGEDHDTKEPPPPDWKTGELGWRNSRRAKHAVERLRDHPDWQRALERASARHGIPVKTLVAFIEMESGWNPDSAPMWENKDGRIIKGKFSREEARERGLKLYSSAHGLAQAMRKNVPTYARERYQNFRSENPHLTLPAEPDLYNPLIAIDFAAYHLKEIVAGVNRIVDGSMGARKELKPEWKLDPAGDITYLYMAYNNGAYGYLVLRRYLENPTRENEEGLVWFQKRMKRDRNGNEMLEGTARARYASRVAQVASAVEYAPSSARIA